MLSEGEGQTGEERQPWVSWQASYVGVQNQGMEYSLGKGEFGVIFPNFHFSCIFRRGGAILSLFGLNLKCHIRFMTYPSYL